MIVFIIVELFEDTHLNVLHGKRNYALESILHLFVPGDDLVESQAVLILLHENIMLLVRLTNRFDDILSILSDRVCPS